MIRPSHEYFFGADHQVGTRQLLSHTILAQQTLNSVENAFDVYEQLASSVSQDKTPHAVISSSSDNVSSVSAVLVNVPYATRITPTGTPKDIAKLYSEDPKERAQARNYINMSSWNMLTKHRFLYEVLKTAEIFDEEGKTLPILVVSSPSTDNSERFNPSELLQLAQGDMRTFADIAVSKAESEGFSRVIPIGYSLGGIVVPTIVERAKEKAIEVPGFVIAEPAMREGVVPTALAFMNFGKRPMSNDPRALTVEEKTGGWVDQAPLLARRLRGCKEVWMNNIPARPLANLAILFGLAKPEEFKRNVKGIIESKNPPRATFAFSRHSRLSRGFEDFLGDSESIATAKEEGRVQVLRADGHNSISDQHGFGENPQYYADMMARGIRFALTDD